MKFKKLYKEPKPLFLQRPKRPSPTKGQLLDAMQDIADVLQPLVKVGAIKLKLRTPVTLNDFPTEIDT